MDTKHIMIVIGIILVGFVLYIPLRDRLYGVSESFEQPARGAVEMMAESYSPPKAVAPSGPNAPAQAAPRGEVVIHGEEAPRDPIAEDESAASAAPTMTYPERSFRPPPKNDQTNIAYESGVAGQPRQTSPQASQKFGLEMVQNSGEFYGGVYANDTMSDTNFSTF